MLPGPSLVGGRSLVPDRTKQRRNSRPPASRLGLNRLTYALLASTAVLVLISAAAFHELGLSVNLGDVPLVRGVQFAIAVAIWAYYFVEPGGQNEWITAEASVAFLLTLMIAVVVTTSQYAAAAFARPTVDGALAAGDAMLGLHVPSLVARVRAHPDLTAGLRLAYRSFVPQVVVIVPLLWLRNDRRRLWEYTFNFHLTAVATLIASALWPVACAFQYYGFESLLPQEQFTVQFMGFRASTLTVVDMNNLQGLISMPSFHVAGALIVTWALRGTWWLVLPAALLNAALMASTVLTGAHYGVDVLAAVLLVVVTVTVYRRFVEPWARIDPPESA